MLRTICKQFLRPIATLNVSPLKYQCCNWRLFCSNETKNDYGGLTVNDTEVLNYLKNAKTEYCDLVKRKETLGRDGHEKIRELQQMVEIYECRNAAVENLKLLNEEMAKENDAQLLAMMKDEKKEFLASIESWNSQLMESIFDMPEDYYCSSMFLEVTAGVGGQEAMLFASEIRDMYTQYCSYKRWNIQQISEDTSEIGGLRHASYIVTGDEAFNLLRFEAGVHRVQRIPSTEKAGRVHTSTVTVAVIPKSDEVDLNIKEKDLKIETKRASGAGGQHVNTTDSAVRIVHIPTGLSTECQTERSQTKNKELAMIKLQAALYKQHYDAENASTNATRKSQVGSSLRNEKIRTYNYNQDRVTDHRIENGTTHNLEGFLLGGSMLDELIKRLRLSNRRNEIIEIIKKST